MLKRIITIQFKNKTIPINTYPKPLLLLLQCVLIISCKVSHQPIKDNSFITLIENSSIFKGHFTGFSLYDPASNNVIYNYNADKHFTAASNTKLFTLYTCLQIIGDSVPSFKYAVKDDSLFIKGTGDPSFLHPEFTTSLTYKWLKGRNEKIIIVDREFQDKPYGPGWSWDDYQYAFSSEKSAFPIYGNYVRFIYMPFREKPEVQPTYFAQYLKEDPALPDPKRSIVRDFLTNDFHYRNRTTTAEADTIKIPFKYSPELFAGLLSDTLQKEVILIKDNPLLPYHSFYGFSTDSLYKEMMWESDNFIAEQLLILASSTLSDTLSSLKVINYAKKNFFHNFQDSLSWKDGSGLSRYNLFTPRSLIHVLKNIYDILPPERIHTLFPAGGETGNIKKWYKSDTPYVFAKSGTLSNVHCLSGYLVTRSGKTMIFSFMHNNFTIPTSLIRYEMEKVLRQIHMEY